MNERSRSAAQVDDPVAIGERVRTVGREFDGTLVAECGTPVTEQHALKRQQKLDRCRIALGAFRGEELDFRIRQETGQTIAQPFMPAPGIGGIDDEGDLHDVSFLPAAAASYS